MADDEQTRQEQADDEQSNVGGQVQHSSGVEASQVEALVIKNTNTGDTLFIDMETGEGVFIGGTQVQAQVQMADATVMDEDVDLSFGSRRLVDDADEEGGESLPDLLGYLERWLLPASTARHARNFRRHLLLAGRSLLDAGVRGIEKHDRVDALGQDDYTGSSTVASSDGAAAGGGRQRPSLRGLNDSSEVGGLRSIELELG